MKHLYFILIIFLTVWSNIRAQVVGGISYGYSTATRQAYVVQSSIHKDLYNASIVSQIYVDNKEYTVVSIKENAFAVCTRLNTVTIPNTVTSIGRQAFYGCTGLYSITIGNSVTNIGDYAFYKCNDTYLTSITLPNTVTSIGNFAFAECTGFTNFTIPNNVKTIGNNAFQNCTGLKNISIPNSVTSIGDQAFDGCTSMTNVIIGSVVKTIGKNAFNGCTNAIFFCDALTPPSCDGTSFPSNSIIYVPIESLSKYTSNSIWSQYNIVGKVNLGSELGTKSFGGSGSGSKNDPYLIFNPVQLYNVRNFTGYSNVYFKLMADIDLTEFIADNSPNEGWEPIGSQNSPFKGNFNGNGHKISGIKINRKADFIGLFGCLSSATITNTTIEGSVVEGQNYVGALAGITENTTITNIKTSINVKGNQYAGGLVGQTQLNDKISNSSVIGNVNCSGNNTGGLIGYSALSVINSTNFTGSIYGVNYTGGVIGYATGITATNCNVSSNKVSALQYTGGVIGYANDITATNCYAIVDNVNGTEFTGGFAGRFSSSEDIVNSCGVVANVHGKTPMGGFTGFSNGTLSNLFAVGDITSEQGVLQYVGTGGIAGQFNGSGASLTNSYFSGNIRADNSYVGGLVGSARASTISKNYSKAAIDGLKYVGGIVGYARTTTSLSSNVAAGEVVNAVDGEVGRIFGTKESTVTIGSSGTSEANRGLTTMRIVSQGLQVTPTDGEQHGTNLGKSLLKYKTTYQGLNWDFTSDWTILDTESFPYKPEQCAPPTINGNLASGMTTISGNSIDGGTVYVTVNGKKYTATTSNNQWNVTVDPLPSGETVKVFATVDGKVQSYIVTAQVGYAGSGTEDDPYLIYTASDLANINSYSYYKVMNDIDLTDYIAAHDNTKGWEPIGFTGGGTMKQLDGNGKTISGLWFNRTYQNCGLISNIQNTTIKNLIVKVASGKNCKVGDDSGIVVGKATNCVFSDITVEGNIKQNGDIVGGVIGKSIKCTISNTKFKGDVSTNNECAGGIVGILENGYATNCSFEGKVTGITIGGIVGYATGTGSIYLCSAQGSVIATEDESVAGGIVGETYGNIQNCSSFVDVKGDEYAGGIVALSHGKVENCYSCGDITGTGIAAVAAGIVGYLDGANAAVNHCFAINSHIDVSDQKGVVMRVIGGFKNGAPTPAATNYALKSMVVSVNGVTQTIYDDVLEGKGVQLATLKQQATYTAQGWDFNETWGINEGEGYPYLQWTVVEPEPEYVTGDANGDGRVLINDVVLTANYIVNGSAPNFVFDAADVNKDGKILVNDVVLIANIILSGSNAAPAMRVRELAPAGNDYLSASALNIKAGETRYIDIALNNDNNYSAMQMDVTLPDGLLLKNATLTGRASGHAVMTGMVDGATRIATFSTANEDFDGNSGAILRLEVVATDNVTSDIAIDNIFVSTARGALKQLDAVNVVVNDTATGVDDINAALNQKVNVYNTAGQLVRCNVNSENATTNLPAGLYLVGNKKVVVR